MLTLLRCPKLKLSFAVFFLLISLCTAVSAQDDPERARAFQLFAETKYTEALPVFEKLAAKYPADGEVLKRYGFLVMGQTAYLKDAAARKEARRKGREILLQAQKLGADDALVRTMIEGVPADGGDDARISSKKEAEDAMREGEAAFAKKDFAKALESYQTALLFDPELYEAALFTGDVYYSTSEQKKAGEWFERATKINPDRETAYRYWGDSLMKQGKVTEAGEKFVEAYIAEPYNRLARAGFVNWGDKVHIELAHPRVELPADRLHGLRVVALRGGLGGRRQLVADLVGALGDLVPEFGFAGHQEAALVVGHPLHVDRRRGQRGRVRRRALGDPLARLVDAAEAAEYEQRDHGHDGQERAEGHHQLLPEGQIHHLSCPLPECLIPVAYRPVGEGR